VIAAHEVLNHIYAASVACLEAPGQDLVALGLALDELHTRAEREMAAHNLATCAQVCQRCAASPAVDLWEPDDVAGIEVCAGCAERLHYERMRSQCRG